MVDPNTVKFLQVKAEEKGIEPVYAYQKKGQSSEKTIKPEEASNYQLRRMESDITSMQVKMNELINFLTAIDSKVSNIMASIEELKRK